MELNTAIRDNGRSVEIKEFDCAFVEQSLILGIKYDHLKRTR